MNRNRGIKRIETKTGFYWHDPKTKITYAVDKQSVGQKIELGKESYGAILEINNGKVHPLLVDIRNSSTLDRILWNYYASDKHENLYNACAILIENPVSRIVGNFFLGLKKPKNPTSLFSDKMKALEWLQNYVHK